MELIIKFFACFGVFLAWFIGMILLNKGDEWEGPTMTEAILSWIVLIVAIGFVFYIIFY